MNSPDFEAATQPAVRGRRKRRIVIVCWVSGVFAVAGLALAYGLWSFRQVPPFYQQAIAEQAPGRQRASQEMERRLLTLYNHVQRDGRWQARFSADQINGWFAVDLLEKHRDLLPEKVQTPRVAIAPDNIMLGFCWHSGELATIVTVKADVFLSRPNVLACRIREAQAGTLPFPLKRVLDQIQEAAQALDLPLHWTRMNGDPVALLTITPGRNQKSSLVHWDTLELRDGEILLSGITVGEMAKPESGEARTSRREVSTQSDAKTNRQR